MNTQDRITKAHVWIMGYKNTLHYSGILMYGDVILTDEVPTAATNGRDVKYNPDYVNSLTDQELRASIIHEAGHKCYQHLFLWQSLYKEDPELANKACDYMLNIAIYDMDPHGRDIKLPEGVLLDEKYRGMDSKQIFDLLKQDKQNGKGSGSGEPMDGHEWEEAAGMPEEEQQAIAKEIDAAMRQGAFLSGKMGGNVDRAFGDMLTPQVDWREQLRDFMESVCQGKGESTWAKPNKRWLGQNIYLPSQISESIGSIVVGIDTSGSISGEAINKALTELLAICENVTPERVHLLYWDSKVAGHEVYCEGEYDKLLASTSPRGGGGTQCECVFEYVKEFKLEPVVCVMISDLYTPFPDAPAYPVLWVAVDNERTVPPFGTTIRLK